MNDKEKINLIERYLYVCETYVHNDLIKYQNAVIRSSSADLYDLLKLFKAQTRYEAYSEFVRDLEKILYGF